jgi:hypothetical protein
MNKAFDSDRGGRDRWIDWLAARMAECLRLARPGAHALIWSLPRTSHWAATAIEDAGWIIDDRISHIFGQGFPKHKSKLKPAVEDWWLCTKPGGEKWLNVDACRVENRGPDTTSRPNCVGKAYEGKPCYRGGIGQSAPMLNPAGRYPPNLVFTHHPLCETCGTRRVKGITGGTGNRGGQVYRARSNVEQQVGYAGPDGTEVVPAWNCVEGLCPIRALDRQSGERQNGGRPGAVHASQDTENHCYGKGLNKRSSPMYADFGGASRYFPQFSWQADDFAPFLYCPKASKRDRGPGNTHPTVKPQMLMRWLCRLSCRPGDTILDPFAGSGSTLRAARSEGFRAIGIESDPDYYALAARLLRGDKLPLFD